jgi:hypothetical protein
MDIKLGDLILVRGTDWISHTIEEVEHSPYSHVAGVVKNNELIEAQGFKPTGYQALDAYRGFADVFRCESMTNEQRESILHTAELSIGGQYDYWLLVVEWIRYWFGVIVPYREPPNVRICSVLWAGIYRDQNIDLCPGIKYPTPKDISESKLLRKIGSL